MDFLNTSRTPRQSLGGRLGDAVSRHRTTLFFLLACLLFSGFLIIRFEISGEIHDVDAVGQENQTWTISQLETDLVRYTDALDLALHGSGVDRFEDVFTWFDVLSGRVDALRSILKARTPDLANDPAWLGLAGPKGLLSHHRVLIDPLYESGDRYPEGDLRTFIVNLPEMMAEARQVSRDIRPVIVRAFLATTADVSTVRTELARTLSLFTGSLFITIALMAVLIGLIFRRAQERQKQLERSEREARNFLAMLDSSQDTVLIADSGGNILWGNPASASMLGYDRLAPSPPALSEFLLPNVPGGDLGGFTPETQRIRLTARHIDGHNIPVEVSGSRWADGARDEFMVYFIRDISDRISFEEEMASARNAALKGEEAKARFLAVMSHEMRTPLNGLLAAADLMSRKVSLTGDAARFTAIMRSCAHQTLDHINNVLELTRLEDQDGAHYARTDVPLLAVLQAIAVQFEADAERRGVQINFAPQPENDIQIEASTALLRRVIGNLMSNAVKFTDEGHIDIVVKALPTDEAEMREIRISVCDTGIGISEENLNRIFETFETLDASYARVQEGSGLGLGIAKLAAEAMGGRIELKSHPGAGSNFTLVFPAKLSISPPQIPPVPEQTSHRKLRILVAEDNKTSRELLEETLLYIGHQVECASDGAEAVAKANLMTFDAILMDIAMPQIDGLMATRIIREQGLNKTTPVIGLTAQADAGIVDLPLSEGFRTVLLKPASLEQIEAALAGLDVVESEDVDPDEVELVNMVNFMAKLRMVGWEKIRELSNECLGAAVASLTEIEDTMPDKLLEIARILAHREAGGAASLGFLELQREWLGMERAAKDESISRILEGISRIRDVIFETRTLLEVVFREESLKTA